MRAKDLYMLSVGNLVTKMMDLAEESVQLNSTMRVCNVVITHDIQGVQSIFHWQGPLDWQSVDDGRASAMRRSREKM